MLASEPDTFILGGGADPGDDDAIIRRVTFSARRSGLVVEMRVADTGPGLPAKARENLFQPFRGSARSGGTGLGLAIARELVLAHGGSISLDDTVSQGTAFRIELPDQPLPLDKFRASA